MKHKLINCFIYAKEALINLYSAKLRSMLALIGIVVGSASVVAMVLGGQLATHEALNQFKALGTDLLAVTINDSMTSHLHPVDKLNQLTIDHALALSSLTNVIAVAPYTQSFYLIYYQGQLINAQLLGVTDSFARIIHINLTQGRFVSLLDTYEFFCVIGHDIAEAIHSISHRSPLGDQIQINNNIFTIIGIAEEWPDNNFVYANINAAVMIPVLASLMMSQYVSINNIIVQLSSFADLKLTETAIEHTINQSAADKNITFRSAKELINKMKKQNDILTVFLGLIGSISLFVGGIGVMNIMLISVVERRREIGIRLSVGAKPSDIGLLFLIEAMMLSFLGGIIGVGIGILIAYIIAWCWHWQFVLFIGSPIAGFFVSIIVGMIAGVYPAYQAAKLHPIAALRG